MRRLVREMVRMLIWAAVVKGAMALGRVVLGRISGEPGNGASSIRTGSFDAWPDVPTAPPGHRSGT